MSCSKRLRLAQSPALALMFGSLTLAQAWAQTPNPDPWQLPLYRAVMAQPLQAPYRVGMLADAYAAANSPQELIRLTGTVAGLTIARPEAQTLLQTEAVLRESADPLAAAPPRVAT